MGQTYSAVMKSIITRCNNNVKVDKKMHVSIIEECTDIRDSTMNCDTMNHNSVHSDHMIGWTTMRCCSVLFAYHTLFVY